MIKTLKISIIITTILALFFFVLSAAFGLRHDKDKEAFLAKPTATEIFKKNAVRPAGQAESPLLKQAQAFALRINPPKPVEQQQAPVAIHKVVEAPKFKLLGTSYVAQDPNKSMALIDEPGKGIHWVSPSDQIDYLKVLRIEDGKIVYTDGKTTMEMVTEKPPETSSIIVISGPSTEPEAPEINPQPQEQVVPNLDESQEKTTEKTTTQNEVESNVEFIKRLMAEANENKDQGISGEEANELKGLGEFLKRVEEEEQKQNEANAAGAESQK